MSNNSSKKDSKSTENLEYTEDIKVKTGHETLPAGLNKVLELLGSSLEVDNPSGSLEVNSSKFRGAPGEHAMLIATYKNSDGKFEPDKIQVPCLKGTVNGDCMIFQLPIEKGKITSYIVSVSGVNKKVIVKTIDAYTELGSLELAYAKRE